MRPGVGIPDSRRPKSLPCPQRRHGRARPALLRNSVRTGGAGATMRCASALHARAWDIPLDSLRSPVETHTLRRGNLATCTLCPLALGCLPIRLLADHYRHAKLCSVSHPYSRPRRRLARQSPFLSFAWALWPNASACPPALIGGAYSGGRRRPCRRLREAEDLGSEPEDLVSGAEDAVSRPDTPVSSPDTTVSSLDTLVSSPDTLVSGADTPVSRARYSRISRCYLLLRRRYGFLKR